jgi:hypothetical protein
MGPTINEINRIKITNSDFEIGWMLKNNTTFTETINSVAFESDFEELRNNR